NVHLRVTKAGQPVACVLTPGSSSDGRTRKTCRFDVPAGSHVSADSAYHDSTLADVVLAAAQMRRYPLRKKGSKRPRPPYIADVPHDDRQRVETVGRLSERLLPKTLPAVTAAGFEVKVFLVVLAYSFNGL